MAVAILRLPKGLDYSHLSLEVSTFSQINGGLTSSSSVSNITQLDTGNATASLKHKNGNTNGNDTTIMPADSYLNLTTLAAANGANGTNGNGQTRKFLHWFVLDVDFSLEDFAQFVLNLSFRLDDIFQNRSEKRCRTKLCILRGAALVFLKKSWTRLAFSR